MKIPEGWPTDEMTQAGFLVLPAGFNRIGYDALRSVLQAALEAAPTPPTPEVEPVAWMHNESRRVDVVHAEAKGLWLKVSPKRVEHYTIPLYTHPANDELLKALRQCQNALEPYDDIKPRDWKTDREKLAAAHQAAKAILARYQEGK
ncbi:hypothetical protein [Nitrosovibrio sp. Nv4]|uniref:hypothetical protein n=1 Tax=Nitrosovibrio sp. Nv4 TaxID=1945880 RepID=UPI000BCDB62E|nr:hypothetical protein [Nitrosovibrio sp. Nv4]SOD42427.1 hypothetical protein SAMN06298226_2766 [Nitrosovibrio sp. Nv4]